MAQYTFGIGTVVGKRTDLINQPPAFLGVAQDIQIDVDQTLKALMGQLKMAVDVAPAELKIQGKAKFARIQASTINNLFLGQTETSNSGIDLTAGEDIVIGTTNVVVANHSTFLEDFGVFYKSSGVQLIPVASAPAQGQYVAGAPGAGQYLFNATDVTQEVLIYYSYTVNTLYQVNMSNQPMGQGPVFELMMSTPYQVLGVTKRFNLKLNACRSSKMSFPFKNQDYVIQEFDFQAFADASNNIGSWSLSE